MLARVHIAKDRLGMSDEDYRAMLVESYGVDSAGKLQPELLAELMRSLEAQAGKAPLSSGRGGLGGEVPYPGRPANIAGETSRAAQLQKIEALLAEAKRPWSYADALARRICKVEKVAWVPGHQLYQIIAALVKDAQRHGRRTR